MNRMNRMMIGAALALPLMALPALAGDSDNKSNLSDEQKKLDKAEQVLKASLDAPDKGIPKEALEKAECVGVFPDVKKAAFVVGGQGGSGVFTCRDASGKMGAPAFFKIGGASVGWQFGGQETDLVLLVMNKNGMSHLLEDKFTLGAEATATAGPVGRTAKAATDAQMNAQILSWSRSQGAFLGAALDGSVVKPDKDSNEKVYGKAASARSILMGEAVDVPAGAASFIRTVNANTTRG
jgi:lipid-binding SYLF domain-containing protein